MNHKEILLVVDAVSNEKSISRQIIFEAIESALATATKKLHSEDIDSRVSIDQESGEYDTFRRWEVISDDEALEYPARQYYLDQAQEIDPDIEIGGFISLIQI